MAKHSTNQDEAIPQNATSQVARCCATAFLVFLIAISPFFALEVGARMYVWYKNGAPGKSYGLWCYDKELGAIHCLNGYNSNAQTNDYGFRNTENVLNPKPAEALRVIVYGGSTVFCYNLLNGQTWPDELEKQLRAHHNQHDQVLNAGAIMWSIGHSYARAKRDIPILKPDFVIIYDGINDGPNAQFLEQEGRSLKTLVQNGDYGAVATQFDQSRWIKRNLALVRLMDYFVTPFFRNETEKVKEHKEAEAITEPSAPISTEPVPEVLENYQHVLTDFIKFIKDNGAKPVFVVTAHGHNNKVTEYLTSYSRHGIQTAIENGAAVVDAQEVVDNYKGQPMDLFYKSGVHVSALGAKLYGEAIFQNVFSKDPALTLH